MKGQPSVWRRTQKLEAVHGDAASRRYARQVAEREGIDPEELWAEALAFKRECAQLGLHTEEERLAHTARELGMRVEELRAEIARMTREDADWRLPR